MKLSAKAISAIKEPAIRRKLAELLDCTDQSIIRYIKDNEANGELTKVAVLQLIKDATKLENVLEESEVKEPTR